MEWKQKKPHLWEREDGYSIADHGPDRWMAAKPNGLILRDGQDKIRRFGDRDAAIAFVDRYHRNPQPQ